jgi:hypothetical protein
VGRRMTPDEKESIRARDARGFTGESSYSVEWEAYAAQALSDRRALLTALDEAEAECAQSKAEVDRLTAEVRMAHIDWQNDGRCHERDRIEARVRVLRGECHSRSGLMCDVDDNGVCTTLIPRAAVIAIVRRGRRARRGRSD